MALVQYRANQKPWYTLGHGIVLAYIGIGLLCSVTYILLLRRENARRERGERDEIITGVNDGDKHLEKNGVFASIADAKREKGDRWGGYRYRL